MIGLRLIGSLADAREIVRQSFDVKTYEPRDPVAVGRAVPAVLEVPGDAVMIRSSRFR